MKLFSRSSKAPATAVSGAALARATREATAGTAGVSVLERPGRRSPNVISQIDDLPVFRRKLYDEIGLRPSLRHEICPIEIGDGASMTFALVLLESLVNSDIADEIVRQLTARKYKPGATLYYPATTPILVELCRDNVMENRPKGKALDMDLSSSDRSALWRQFESAVRFSMLNNASDLHIEIDQTEAKSQIAFRVDGRLTRPREFQLKTSTLLDMGAYLYNLHGKSGSDNGFNANLPQACRIQADIDGRRLLFRWASNQSSRGCKIVMRMLYQDTDQSVRSLAELGYLPDQITMWERAIARLGGGSIISGVVGSGKSTTIQTVMTMLPDWMARYTVEDPVEYTIPGTTQFSVSRALNDEGRDPFIGVKRQLKRMDPDAVLVGEIRDHESSGLFRDIAESGHRAFATVHAPGAIDIITLRLPSEELGIPRDVIATPGFLNLLVYQALLPVTCPHCKLNAEQALERRLERVSPTYLGDVRRLFDISADKLYFRNPDGCNVCRREGLPELNGARGRSVVAELIELDTNMLILARDPGKNLELKRYVRSLNRSRYDEPVTTGKSVLEVAMYKVSQGAVDPREVELKFGSFYQYERERAIDRGADLDPHNVVEMQARRPPSRTRGITGFRMAAERAHGDEDNVIGSR